MVQDLGAETDRALIKRQEVITSANNDRDVAVIEANQRAEVAIVKAKSKLQVSKQDGERKATEMREKVRADQEARKVEVNQEYQSRTTRASARLEVQKRKAEAIKADADVEATASTQLGEQRNYEVGQLRLDVMTGFAKNSNMVICGETGEQMLALVAPGSKHDRSQSTK
jgi:uncharacterized membrane protein YqiK